jgi:hypothetical protein
MGAVMVMVTTMATAPGTIALTATAADELCALGTGTPSGPLASPRHSRHRLT